jgi:hypothetical protein
MVTLKRTLRSNEPIRTGLSQRVCLTRPPERDSRCRCALQGKVRAQWRGNKAGGGGRDEKHVGKAKTASWFRAIRVSGREYIWGIRQARLSFFSLYPVEFGRIEFDRSYFIFLLLWFLEATSIILTHLCVCLCACACRHACGARRLLAPATAD